MECKMVYTGDKTYQSGGMLKPSNKQTFLDMKENRDEERISIWSHSVTISSYLGKFFQSKYETFSYSFGSQLYIGQ